MFQSSIAPKDDRYEYWMRFNRYSTGLFAKAWQLFFELFQSSIAPKDDRYSNQVKIRPEGRPLRYCWWNCVSILRPEGRPLPQNRRIGRYKISFNPRSPRRTTAIPIDQLFQSSIAPKDDYRNWSNTGKFSFNPRSPRRTTATAYILTSVIPILPELRYTNPKTDN